MAPTKFATCLPPGTSRARLCNDVATDLALDADAAMMRRVFQNLIGNAIDHA